MLCHTISTTTWRNLYFNETCVGEFGINAALCGHYNCPVVLITEEGGDASVLIGDFISLVYSLLGGELTTRFVLKVLVVGAIAGEGAVPAEGLTFSLLVGIGTARGVRRRATDPDLRSLGQALAATIASLGVSGFVFDLLSFRQSGFLLFLLAFSLLVAAFQMLTEAANPAMAKEWARRFGPSYYSFVHQDVNAGTGTSFVVNTSLSPGTTYYYRVRAENSAGGTSAIRPLR